jgi:uncharacterized repeat protein (TIGR02543 family)
LLLIGKEVKGRRRMKKLFSYLRFIVPVFALALVLVLSAGSVNANAAPANTYKVGQVLEGGEQIEYVKDPTIVYFEDDHYTFLYESEFDTVPEGKWIVTEITDDPVEGFSIYLREMEQYTIIFLDAKGKKISSKLYYEGATVEVPEAPEKEATKEAVFIFTGWEPAVTKATKDQTYKPVFSEKKRETFKITYIVDEKEVTKTGNPSEYLEGIEENFLKVVYKDNYDFIGWFDKPEGGNEITSITKETTGDLVLYARFEKTPDKEQEKEEEVPHDDDLPKGMDSDFGKLFAKMTKYTKNSITIEWKKIKGADGYDIYGSMCNSHTVKRDYQYVTSVKAGKTKYVAKDLRESTYYKYYVEAYKIVDGKKKIITRSALIHGTTLSKKNGVAEKITVDKTKVTLKVGETVKLTGTEYNEKKTIRQHRPICFESSNEKVAKVKAKKGVVTAGKPGTCKIWVYAQNGLYTCCEVTVVE